MKKNVKMTIAALCAAIVTAGVVTAPVCAAEEKSPVGYVLGDVNMDGKVGLDDCLTAMQEQMNIRLFKLDEHVLNEEQIALAKTIENNYPDVRIADAWGILAYYTRKTLEGDETVTWKSLLGEEFFNARIATCDRGEYTLVFDDTVGDYVIVKRG